MHHRQSSQISIIIQSHLFHNKPYELSLLIVSFICSSFGSQVTFRRRTLQYFHMTQKGEKLDFYTKLRKQFEKGAKPFLYEFSFSEQPKHKKFRILLGKFVEILKEGMSHEYRYEEDSGGNYWSQLEREFASRTEMRYIVERVYEVADKKIRIFLALLIHTRQVFKVMETLLERLPHLYIDIKAKRDSFQSDIAPVSFLRDAQVEIESPYVREYHQWLQAINLQQIETRKAIEKLLQQMAEIVHENILIEEEEKAREEQRRREETEALRKKEQYQRNRKLQQKIITQPRQDVKPDVTAGSNTNLKDIKPDIYLIQTPFPLDLNLKPRHLRNSEHLFNQKFKDQLQVFHYEPCPSPSQKKSKCFECEQPLSPGFMYLGSNLNYCNYFGEWFCNDHTAEQRVQIPYKAKEQFDLRGYNVSKRGYERIKSYFQKAIIEINYDDPLVKRNRKLYDFLVLRRQLHLMYDSICNSELMDKMLRGRLNYCLKRNIFSLKNLYDIYNGHEQPALEREFAILAKHFYKCEICQDRKGRLCAVCKQQPKIFAFQLKETHACEHCHKISHRRCLLNNKCPCGV